MKIAGIFGIILFVFCLCDGLLIIADQTSSAEMNNKNTAKVKVTFNVVIPGFTPPDEKVFLYGSMNNWDPGPTELPDSTDLPLIKQPNGSWQITLELDGNKYEYKYTRGSFRTIEKATDSTDILNRAIFLNPEIKEVEQKDTVVMWNDYTLPPEPENGYPIISLYNDNPQTSAAISWATDSVSDSKIYYGLETISDNEVRVTEQVDMIEEDDNLIHVALLENLIPDTEYKYKVVTEGVYESDQLNFKTAGFEKNFMFIVIGDNRPGGDTGVMNGIIKDKPSFVIHAGDLVQYGKKLDDWFGFLNNWKQLLGTIPWLAVYGNHEIDSYLNQFFRFPSNNSINPDNWGHWFSINYNNIHITALDIYRDYLPGSEQYDWLINDLNSIDLNIDHRIVVLHEPPFSSGPHGSNMSVREHLVPLFEENNIDLVFCGHEHLYERSYVSGVQYVTTGGAGSPLYYIAGGSNLYSLIAETVFHYCRVYIDNKNIKLEMVRSDGTIGETLEIVKEKKTPPPSLYRLEQNYPNPFNLKTNISFSLPNSDYVTLKIYNTLGQEVVTLINQYLGAGYYNNEFNGNGISSGIYFYELDAGPFRDIKKLILLK
ncbi:metallophosphoesterase [Bacteroidota bacterium]